MAPSKKPIQICSICGRPYAGHGNNAWPYEGRCCNDCNSDVVIPDRVLRMIAERRLAIRAKQQREKKQ